MGSALVVHDEPRIERGTQLGCARPVAQPDDLLLPRAGEALGDGVARGTPVGREGVVEAPTPRRSRPCPRPCTGRRDRCGLRGRPGRNQGAQPPGPSNGSARLHNPSFRDPICRAPTLEVRPSSVRLVDQPQDVALDAYPEQQAEAVPGAYSNVIVKSPQVDPVVRLVQTLLRTFVPLGTQAHMPEPE
jgi:hypothetical protein